MKKRLSAILVGTLLTVSAQAESYIDYVSVGLALQTLQDINNENFNNSVLEKNEGVAVVLTVGKNLFSDISLEFEGSASVVKPEWELGKTTAEVDFWSLGMYGAYIWRINNLCIKPRIGVVYENIKATMNSLSLIDKADMALSGGIGFTYDFGRNYSIYTNYTKFEDDISNLTFGATYKF